MSTRAADRVSASFFYRDESGRLAECRVTFDGPAEAEKWGRVMRRLERAAERRRRKEAEKTVTFTDAEIDPGRVSRSPELRPSQGGYPWEGPRYSFTLLLGESARWSGPDSTRRVDEATGKHVCRFCGEYRSGLPLTAYCLGCDRDEVIPKGRERTERKGPKADGLKGGVG